MDGGKRNPGRLTFGQPQVWGRVEQGATHCGVLTICFFSVVSARTCQRFPPCSNFPTMWQYPFVQILRPGGKGGQLGGWLGVRVAAHGPGKAWASWDLCNDRPLTRSPMASPSWPLGTVRLTSSVPWWLSRTRTQPAWPSGHCSVRAGWLGVAGQQEGAQSGLSLVSSLQVPVCW